MRLSVIIPTRDRSSRLAGLLARLAPELDTAGLDAEVVIVDDGSAPEEAARIREATEQWPGRPVHLVRRSVSRGAGAARNIGVKIARGHILAFLDDDLIPDAGYLQAIVRLHEQHPGRRVINGDLRPVADDVYSRFWYSRYGTVFPWRDSPCHQIEGLASGFMSATRDVVDELGELFDPGLVAREDYDLFLRLRRRGITIWKSDVVRAANTCRRSLPALIRQYAWYARGEYQLRRKYGDALPANTRRRAPSCFVLIEHVLRMTFQVCYNFEVFRHERRCLALVRVADGLLGGAAGLAWRRTRMMRRWRWS